MCGDTEIDAGNFRVKVNNMYKVAAGNGTNGFVQQFQVGTTLISFVHIIVKNMRVSST